MVVTFIVVSATPLSTQTELTFTDTFELCDILNFPVSPFALILIVYDFPTVVEEIPDVMLKLAALTLGIFPTKYKTVEIITKNTIFFKFLILSIFFPLKKHYLIL